MSLELSGTNKITHDNLNQNIKDLLTPKNWIINGGFDVWQRGTSQTSSGYGSDDRYVNYHNISTKTHSRQAFNVGQTDVPNNPTYFSRTILTTGGTTSSACTKVQRIEDVTKLAGKTVSLSFWAKADASKNLSISFNQDFGTGGSASVVGIGAQRFALTNSWQRFTKTILLPSVSGKTLGTSHNLAFWIWFEEGGDFASQSDSLGNQSGTFDIANVSLVEGSTPVEWQTEIYADVLRQCQRYYVRFIGNTSGTTSQGIGWAGGTNYGFIGIPFKVKMRTVPTSLEYSNFSISNLVTFGSAISSLTIFKVNIDFVLLRFETSSSGFSAGTGVSTDLGSTDYIGFSAEL